MTVIPPPHIRYGSIPKMKESIQERTMIMYPSCRVIVPVFRTNINGKIPAINVITKLIRSAASALSFPFLTETRTEKNINKALTNNA